MAPQRGDQEPYPLYNTTFALHRLSPLYIGNNTIDDVMLRQHARRFRDILVGDVMRGVRVGLASEGDPVSTAGTLKTVSWHLLPSETLWNSEGETNLDEDNDTTINLASGSGWRLTVEYEKTIYSAILLRDVRGDQDEGVIGSGTRFQRFPLLLSKMPSSLRQVFLDFLSETFDCRVSSLHLPGDYITQTLEKYISNISIGNDGEELDTLQIGRSLRSIVRETEVHIGFNVPSASAAVKTMEIHLAREDLLGLVARGKKIGSQGTEESPLMEALRVYVKGHLALDLRHERVRIVRIACGAFVLGGEGKLKLTEPLGSDDTVGFQARATKALVDALITYAAGGQLAKSLT